MSAITEDGVFHVLPNVFVVVGVLFVIGAPAIARVSELNDDPHRHKAIEALWIGAGFRKGRTSRWLRTCTTVLVGLAFIAAGIGSIFG